ncbi:MAG: serine acetyltransferase [Sphingobacteriales bacterium]|nr:MAG: serine acetyltransferase [Sphingobacteriales bacterium]
MTVRQILQQDLLRYGIRKPVSVFLLVRLLLTHVAPGIKFCIIFRYCQAYRKRNKLLFYIFLRLLRRIKYKYGFDISHRTTIGPGLYIGHFGGVVIHGDAVIGGNCNLSQGMTIGVLVRGSNAGVPTIGDRVFIGPGALILGGISIGNDVLIGANAVVHFDVEDCSVVAAPSASVISKKGSSGYISNTVSE